MTKCHSKVPSAKASKFDDFLFLFSMHILANVSEINLSRGAAAGAAGIAAIFFQ